MKSSMMPFLDTKNIETKMEFLIETINYTEIEILNGHQIKSSGTESSELPGLSNRIKALLSQIC